LDVVAAANPSGYYDTHGDAKAVAKRRAWPIAA
jgi:hypothetical protein